MSWYTESKVEIMHALRAGVMLLAVCSLACNSAPQQVDRSLPALKKCESERDGLQQQINQLKVKLAQALANPGTIRIDPSILEIDGKLPVEAKQLVEGTLTQEQAVSVLSRYKATLEPCYTRALKRNSALHHGSITVNLTMSIKNTGTPTGIRIEPNQDSQMTACMITAIKRWPFPKFQGQAVEIVSPVTLTPKK